MVIQPGAGSRGASRLGCLVALAVLGVAIYYGVGFGMAWLRYVQLLDEMKQQARVAQSIPDETIQLRLERRIEELGLPEQARHFTIRRTPQPRQIEIFTEYQETVDLPFTSYTIIFRPHATAPL